MTVITLNVPARTQTGDVLIAYLQAFDSNVRRSEGEPWDAQGRGWTKIYEDRSMAPPEGGTTHRPTGDSFDPGLEYFVSPSSVAIFQKRAVYPGGSEPFFNNASYAVAGVLLAYVGGVAGGLAATAGSSELGTGDIAALPSVDVQAGDVLLGLVAVNGGGTVNQSSMTLRDRHTRFDLLLQAADAVQAAAGGTGVRNWQISATPGAGATLAWKTTSLRVKCSDREECIAQCFTNLDSCLAICRGIYDNCLETTGEFLRCLQEREDCENACSTEFSACVDDC